MKYKRQIIIIFVSLILIIVFIFIYKNRSQGINALADQSQNQYQDQNIKYVGSEDYLKYEVKNDDMTEFYFLYKKDFKVTEDKSGEKNLISILNQNKSILVNIYVLNKSKYGETDDYIKNILMQGGDTTVKNIRFADSHDEAKSVNEADYKYILNKSLESEYYVKDLDSKNFLVIENNDLYNAEAGLVITDVVRSLMVR